MCRANVTLTVSVEEEILIASIKNVYTLPDVKGMRIVKIRDGFATKSQGMFLEIKTATLSK